MAKLSDRDVGRRKVKIVDAESGETLATGILHGLHFAIGDDRLVNESEATIALDLPEDRGPLGDGASFAHDVKPLEEELAAAEEHPEYGIDVAAVQAALEEAKADAAKREGKS